MINKKNVAVIDEPIDPNMVEHNPPPGASPGIQGLRETMAMFFEGFPDLHITVEDLIAKGDKVVGRMTTTGTNQGEMMGIPATGKNVTYSEIHIVRISDGKAVEHWGISDDMSMMQQLGVIPA